MKREVELDGEPSMRVFAFFDHMTRTCSRSYLFPSASTV